MNNREIGLKRFSKVNVNEKSTIYHIAAVILQETIPDWCRISQAVLFAKLDYSLLITIESPLDSSKKNRPVLYFTLKPDQVVINSVKNNQLFLPAYETTNSHHSCSFIPIQLLLCHKMRISG